MYSDVLGFYLFGDTVSSTSKMILYLAQTKSRSLRVACLMRFVCFWGAAEEGGLGSLGEVAVLALLFLLNSRT